MTHSELKKKALKNKNVKKIYDDLELEFSLLKQLLEARQKSGLTQADIAKKMGTLAPSISRLEKALSSGKYSPTLAALKKYANALRDKFEIKLQEGKKK